MKQEQAFDMTSLCELDRQRIPRTRSKMLSCFHGFQNAAGGEVSIGFKELIHNPYSPKVSWSDLILLDALQRRLILYCDSIRSYLYVRLRRIDVFPMGKKAENLFRLRKAVLDNLPPRAAISQLNCTARS